MVGLESKKSLKYAELSEYEWMCGVGWKHVMWDEVVDDR